MRISPTTLVGKWCVGLNFVFLFGVIFALVSTQVFGVLDMNVGRWWDIEVVMLVPTSIIALVLGVIAIKRKDHSVLVYSSVCLSVLTILFLLMHSLFISD